MPYSLEGRVQMFSGGNKERTSSLEKESSRQRRRTTFLHYLKEKKQRMFCTTKKRKKKLGRPPMYGGGKRGKETPFFLQKRKVPYRRGRRNDQVRKRETEIRTTLHWKQRKEGIPILKPKEGPTKDRTFR